MRQQLSRLRRPSAVRPPGAPTPEIINNDGYLSAKNPTTTHESMGTPTRASSGATHGTGVHVGLPAVTSNVHHPPKSSLVPTDDSGHGCMEAVSAFTKAVCSSRAVAMATGRPDSATKKKTRERAVVSPPLLKTSRGAGTEECRESARDLLRFFGHSPLLHLEGVIWVKMSGERVHCVAAISNWSLFIVPLRGPSLVGALVHGLHHGQQNRAARIIEIPLSSIIDIAMVSAREKLSTFASFEANVVARPFRLVTTACIRETLGTADVKPGRTVVGDERILTFVGFEAIGRLKHFLMRSRESWAVRTAAVGVPTAEMVSCAPLAAHRYLRAVYEAMTGGFRNQVDAQVELMEGLADEMILDTVVKSAFFATGDVFFEIARRLERISAVAAAEVEEETELAEDRLYTRWKAMVDARRLSAVSAVLDAAFFHSLQVPSRLDLVACPRPVSLPAVAEFLVSVYFFVRGRLLRYCESDDIGDENIHGGTRQSLDTFFAGVRRGSDVSDLDSAGPRVESPGTVSSVEDMLTEVMDRVVRALSGMSDAITLFNIEHEHLGVVRNLVGVGLGRAWRGGVQPAASQALEFLVLINERTVCLIEELHLQEMKEREMENARPRPTPVASPSKSTKEKTGYFFRPISRYGGKKSPPGSVLEKSLSPRMRPTSHLPAGVENRSRRNGEQSPRASPLKDMDGKKKAIYDGERGEESKAAGGKIAGREREGGRRSCVEGGGYNGPPSASHASPRGFLFSAPVVLHSYAKLLNALVCGSYNLRAAFLSSCEADLRNIGRAGGYLDVLAGLDGGEPRLVFRESARFLEEILIECDL